MNAGERQLVYFLIIQRRLFNYFGKDEETLTILGDGVLAGVTRTSPADCGRFRIIIVLACISVKRFVHSTVFNVAFSIIWRSGVWFKD
jgi:hypothetical protein